LLARAIARIIAAPGLHERTMKLLSPCLAFALTAAHALGLAPARGEPVADFYRGKTLKIITGYAPGGGFDAYARLLADHLPRHLAGAPTAIVQSMPGAASVKAANYIYGVAPQDGTVLGIPNHAMPMNAFVWREVGDGMDVTKFNWIGRLDTIDVVNAAWHTAGVTSIEDVKVRELILGGTSPTGNSVMQPLALNRMIGTRFKVVQGYKGTTEQYLAMERGETQGVGNAIWSQLKRSHPDWITEKKLVPLYQDGFERGAELATVPAVVELATNDEDLKVLRLLASTSAVGRSFYAGPRVPPERVAALRTAFMDMARDPAFRAAADQLTIVLNPLAGKELQAMIGEFGTYPDALLERTRKLVGQ
jgi:tripartite-type tricarboxylate transporter receptor subunit TctC